MEQHTDIDEDDEFAFAFAPADFIVGRTPDGLLVLMFDLGNPAMAELSKRLRVHGFMPNDPHQLAADLFDSTQEGGTA